MMAVLAYSIAVLCLIAVADSLDPCLHDGHRVIPNEGNRYVNFKITRSETPIDDSRLTEGWYFAGNDKMPENPPASILSCGTKNPIWLNGTHPTNGTEVTRQACVKNLLDDCVSTYDVKIKQCPGGFFVYYLKPTDDTTEAYCFGVGVEGLSTDYTSPKPTASFELSRTYVRGHPISSVHFKCSFLEKQTEKLLYRVFWWDGDKNGNDQLLYTTPSASNATDQKIHLTESVFKGRGFLMGNNVSCSVRAFKVQQGPPGRSSGRSNVVETGIEIQTPVLSFQVNERDISKRTIILKPRLPIGCIGSSQCQLWLTAYTGSAEYDKCQGIVLEHSLCGVRMDSRNYSAELHIPVTTAETGQYRTKAGSYEVHLKTENTFENLIWQNYHLPPIKVQVSYVPISKAMYPGKMCYAHSDPHMRTFDGLSYANHQEGVFTLYTHPKFDSEVQIKHEPCNLGGPMTNYCVCGVAVRSGLDRYVLSVCDNQIDIGYKDCGDNALTVKTENMHHYKIVLPYGTYVMVSIYELSVNGKKRRMNIDVYPSIHDDGGASRGLCGKLDNDCADDFHYKDGTTITKEARLCTSGDFNYRGPPVFIDTWKVNIKRNNLFLAEFDMASIKPFNHSICSCLNTQHLFAVNGLLNEIPCQPNTVAVCSRGKTVGAHSCSNTNRRRRSVQGNPVIPTVHVPQNEDLPRTKRAVPKNWTELEAWSFCNRSMSGSPVFDLCGRVPNARPIDSVENCVQDIMLTGGTEWTPLAVESMRKSCLSELERNTTLRETAGSGSIKSIAEIIEEKACPINCSGHGNCLKGECECEEGFGAFDCSLDIYVGPIISGLLDHGLCDEQRLACDHAYVFGHVFSDENNLTCRLEEFMISLDGKRVAKETHYLPGEFETLIEVICPLHNVRSRRSTRGAEEQNGFVYGYTTSVSNDGTHFQDGHDLFVFNSECQLVTNESGQMHFILKDNFCFIENECVPEGHRAANKCCSICHSNISPTAWVTDASMAGCDIMAPRKIDTGTTKSSYLWVIGVVCGAVVGAVVAGIIFVKLTKNRGKTVGDPTILWASVVDMGASGSGHRQNDMAPNAHFETHSSQT